MSSKFGLPCSDTQPPVASREDREGTSGSKNSGGKKRRSKDLQGTRGLASYGNTLLARIWFPTPLFPSCSWWWMDTQHSTARRSSTIKAPVSLTHGKNTGHTTAQGCPFTRSYSRSLSSSRNVCAAPLLRKSCLASSRKACTAKRVRGVHGNKVCPAWYDCILDLFTGLAFHLGPFRLQ